MCFQKGEKNMFSKDGEFELFIDDDDLDEMVEKEKARYIESIKELQERNDVCVKGRVMWNIFPAPSGEKCGFLLNDGEKLHRLTIDVSYRDKTKMIIEGNRYNIKFRKRESGDNSVINVENEANQLCSCADFDDSFVEQAFIEACAEKNGSALVLAKDIEGKFLGADDKGDKVTFSVLSKRILYRCVYDKAMNYEVPFSFQKSGEMIRLRLYSVCGECYVRASSLGDMREEVLAKVARKIHERKVREDGDISKKKAEEYLELLEKREAYPIVEEENDNLEKSESAITKKYELLRCLYPPFVQRAINRVLKGHGGKTLHRRQALDILVNTEWNKELEINDDAEYLMGKLDGRFCGQKCYKQEIIKMISAFKHRKDRKGGAILLVGAPGVGKTSMFRYAANVAGIPFEKISLNAIGNGEYLTGTPLLYSNATPGKIITTIRKLGNRAIILLDEVDKMEKNGEGDPKTALYELLDANEKFRDNFIDEEIDISDVQFVLTANDTASIPTPILDRVSVVRIDDYSEEEKTIIARDYVLPDELTKYDLEGKRIEFDDEVFPELAGRYTMTAGVRDVERNISNIVRNAAWKLRAEKLESVRVDVASLPEYLGILPCRRDKIEHSYSALRRKFSYFKPEYDPQVREIIELRLAEYESATDAAAREYIRKSLWCLVNILPAEKTSYDLEKIRRRLDESHYGMDSLKDEIITILASEEDRKSSATRCILLDGSSGVGKSSICESIAAASGRKYIKISLNGISNATFIKGSERQYHNSDCGMVAAQLAKAGTDRALILLDEIDKMTATNNGDPFAALIDLLDDSGYFTDAFIGTPINVSNILFIATSNDASRIPAVLRNRMNIISVPSYSASEKLHIAKSYILPKKLTEYGVGADAEEFGDIMDTVVHEYCKGFGLRDVARATDKLVRDFVKRKKLGEKMSCTDEQNISKLLGARPTERGNVASEERYRAGIARALAVSGNEGTTFAVQVTENRFSEEDEITGLPKASTLDSIKIAKLLVSNKLGRRLPTLHFHFGEGGIEKDGPSAGITIFSALYSCMTGIKVPRDIGFTGEIDVFGDVWAIGGAELKIHAAESAGCKRVYIPKQNYDSLLEEGKLSRFECEVIPVENVSELCEALFEGGIVRSI